MTTRIQQFSFMHQIVRHGDVLHFGGMVAKDTSQDMAGQTQQILDHFGELLEANGSDRSKVLTATVYLADFANKAAMNEVWEAWFDPADLPTRATVGVAALGPDVRIEIVFTAAA